MSDERPIFARWRYPFAGIEGKKILLIEFFEARHWRLRHGMSVYPSPKVGPSEPDWSKMFRLRINGRWFGPKQWSFFTMVQAARIVTRILADGKVNDTVTLDLVEEFEGKGWVIEQSPLSDYRPEEYAEMRRVLRQNVLEIKRRKKKQASARG